jgi:hypothetical protein
MSKMSETDKQAIRDFYSKQADDANIAVQERLKAISTTVAEATKSDLQQVHDTMMTAAGSMNTAANTMLTAAQTPPQPPTTPTPVVVMNPGDIGVPRDSVNGA